MQIVRIDSPEKKIIKALVKKFRKSTGICINEPFVMKRVIDCFKKYGKIDGEIK